MYELSTRCYKTYYVQTKITGGKFWGVFQVSDEQTKHKLDKEESEGLIASWERIYKYIMNKIVKENICEVEPVMKEPSKMLNELGKAVDLDEIMNEDQNVQNSQNEWNTVHTI